MYIQVNAPLINFYHMLSTVSLYIAHAEAARTYFGSCYGVKKLKSSGKYSYKVAFQRRKNRVMRVSVYTIVCMCIIISILCIACMMCLQECHVRA